MKRMETVVSIRLPDHDLQLVNNFASMKHKDKSTALRELVEMGGLYFAIEQYTQEKISLGKAAKLAGLTIADMMDLLTHLGIKNKLDAHEYLESKKNAEKHFQ